MSWTTCLLRDVLVKTENINPLKEPNRVFKYVDVSSVSKELLKITETQNILGSEAPSRARKLIKKDDVLFATIRPTLKRVALVPNDLDGEVCSTGYFVLRSNGKLLQKFIFYSLLRNEFMEIMEKIQTGASYPAVTDKQVLEQSISYPSLSIQQKIVEKLDAIFTEIDRATVATEANVKNAEALFQRYLSDIFESGGDGWKKVELPSLCTLFNGRAYNKDELLSAGKYTVLRVGNFFTSDRWYYSDLELDENKYCENGDLLYAWSASFGPKIWTGDKVIYHYHIWKVVPKYDVVNKHFLYYLLMWDVDKIKKDFGTGTTMVHVSKKSMESRVLPFVDLDTQKSIVRNINEVFEKSKILKESYELKKKQLDIYKQLILKQAFNGELVKE